MASLLFARPSGEWDVYPELRMAGRLGDRFLEPLGEELIAMPKGTGLVLVPGHYPVGIDQKGRLAPLKEAPYGPKKEPVWALAALLPQGYTRTLLPAFAGGGAGKELPILGYTAVGMGKNGRLRVAAKKTDEDKKWQPAYFDTPDLPQKVAAKRKEFPHNRIVANLANCALQYHCFTAQNLFYERWEAGMPVSPLCNAACLACISLQPAECCPSPQNRIAFIPRLAEVVEPSAAHLAKAPEAIVSFGQGCEGEPSLQGDLIAPAIRAIRAQTDKGTINMNTNAGSRDNMRKIVAAGIDSLRISLFSAMPENYAAYHRPQNYTFADVAANVRLAKEAGVVITLNLLAYPGFTDREEEIDALLDFVQKGGVSQIQIRNLNIDPNVFDAHFPGKESLGVLELLKILKAALPKVRIGNYSRPVR